MVILRKEVTCFRCLKKVDESNTISTVSVNKESRYECSECYHKNKTQPWGMDDKMHVKKEYQCGRCRYKFKAEKPVCPYCNKGDLILHGNITVRDLL